MRRLRRYLPDGLHHFYSEWRRTAVARNVKVPALNLTQDLYVSDTLQNHPRDGQRRRRLPALRPLRRTLPDRRLGYAEILVQRHESR